MSPRYRVKNLVCESGERLPLLLDGTTGAPLFEPTLFVLTELRALNRASATLAQATRAIMVGKLVLDHLGVDLGARFAEGRVLELGEIEALCKLSALSQEALDGLPPYRDETSSLPAKVASLERVRMRSKGHAALPTVSAETAGIRLMYIRDYIAWLARRRLLRLNPRHPTYQPLQATSRLVVESLSERVQSSARRNKVALPQGMEPADIARMLDVIAPDSPENPWKGEHVRIRNQLIFHWLLGLGLRKSELLIVRLEDINLRSNEVLIARRADDPDEPRADAPNAKTFDRLLVLGDELAALTRAYIHGARRSVKNSRRYPHLILATGTGRPLSKSALNKLFVELRSKVTGVPEELTPHVLRHNWNDSFSELMDKRNVPAEEEEKMRKQQMGWSDRSKMAAVYTKRHVKRKSDEASLELQSKMLPTRTVEE